MSEKTPTPDFESQVEDAYKAFCQLRQSIETEWHYARGEMRTAREDFKITDESVDKARIDEWANYMSGLHFALAQIDHFFPSFFNRLFASPDAERQRDAGEGGAT